MLPPILSEDVCSLKPDADRLTFSVVWKINEKAEIKDVWFGKTIIRSCAKLSYEDAEELIKRPERADYEEAFPKIHNGKDPNDIKQSVLALNKLTQQVLFYKNYGNYIMITFRL